MYVCMNVCMHACEYLCMYARIYVRMYIQYIQYLQYIHTHIYDYMRILLRTGGVREPPPRDSSLHFRYKSSVLL